LLNNNAKESIESLSSAIRANDLNTSAHFHLGRALAQDRQEEAAKQEYKRTAECWRVECKKYGTCADFFRAVPSAGEAKKQIELFCADCLLPLEH